VKTPPQQQEVLPRPHQPHPGGFAVKIALQRHLFTGDAEGEGTRRIVRVAEL
jgi:hypothetical protein